MACWNRFYSGLRGSAWFYLVRFLGSTRFY